MNVPNCYYRVSVKALVLDDQKRFLLLKETDGKWDTPGGGLEFGEDAAMALKREIQEEMGVDAEIIDERPTYFVTSYSQEHKVWFADIYYLAELKSQDFKPSEEFEELRYFAVEDTKSVDLHGKIKEFIKHYDPKNHNL